MSETSFLWLMGLLSRGGTFTLLRAQTLPEVHSWPHTPDSPLRLEVLDSEENVLTREGTKFAPNEACSSRESGDWRVTAAIQLIEEAVSVRLVHEEHVVWSRKLSEPPTLELAAVSLDVRKARQVALRISYSAPEEDAWMAVVYQWAGSKNHRTLYVGKPVKTLKLDLTGIAGGESCRIHVVYSNGLRSTTATSDGFKVPFVGPTLSILRPAPESSVAYGVPVMLQAAVLDEERPGGHRFDDLVWLVDGHQIGSGLVASTGLLSVGEHEVAIEYRGPLPARQSVGLVVERKHDAPIANEWTEWDPVLGTFRKSAGTAR